jgi:hypothetical protein
MIWQSSIILSSSDDALVLIHPPRSLLTRRACSCHPCFRLLRHWFRLRFDPIVQDENPSDERMGDLMERSLEAIYSVQRMAELLVQGPDAEREFILFELQQLLDHCPDDTMKILLPVLCEHVPAWSVDLQTKAAQRLFDVVSLELDQPAVKMVTRAAFGVIQSRIGSDEPAVANLYDLCGGILVDVLPNMKWSPGEITDVISIVDIHSSQPLSASRKIAGRVLGALANCFDTVRVEKEVLPRTIRLFEDKDVQVRGVVVESLACIGASLPAKVTETEVWPRVERLLDPTENARIHATAMRTLAHILQNQREKGATGRLFREQLPPVFNKIATFARRFAAEDQRLVDDDTYMLLEVASEVFGHFVYSLSLFSRRSFMKDAYKAYCQMATCNGPIIRRNCAFNLPGVAKALGERFALELSGLCEFLAKDMDEEVRFILAAGIHQSATLLVPRGNYDRLFGAVCALLEDDNPHVRMNALENFHELLSAFVRDGSDPASIRRLAPVFMNLSALSEGNWRIQKRLAEQLDKCAEIIPADALIENVLPLLFRLTEQGPPLVRHASMHATARALRNIPSIPDRNLAISQFWEKAREGPFWMRLALLDGGAAALQIFSGSLFAERFAPTLLQLAFDTVPNVRIRVAQMLRDLAPHCARLPEYTDAVDHLRLDADPDVVIVMAGHDRAVEVAIRRARENAAQDQARLRDEQEFYGIIPRTTKRVRGHRLNPMRTGRILSNHRRQGTEYSDLSSGHLSVSQAVISAAKANSAASGSGNDSVVLPPGSTCAGVAGSIGQSDGGAIQTISVDNQRYGNVDIISIDADVDMDGPPSAGTTIYSNGELADKRRVSIRRQAIGIDDEQDGQDAMNELKTSIARSSSGRTSVEEGSSETSLVRGRVSDDVLSPHDASGVDLQFLDIGSTTALSTSSTSATTAGFQEREFTGKPRGRSGESSVGPTEPVSLTSLPSARSMAFTDNDSKSLGQLSESAVHDARSSSGSGGLSKHFARGSVAVRAQRSSGSFARAVEGRAKSWTELFGKKLPSESTSNSSTHVPSSQAAMHHRSEEENTANARVMTARAKSYMPDVIPGDSPVSIGSLQPSGTSKKKTRKKKKKRAVLPVQSLDLSVETSQNGLNTVMSGGVPSLSSARAIDLPHSRPPLPRKIPSETGEAGARNITRSTRQGGDGRYSSYASGADDEVTLNSERNHVTTSSLPPSQVVRGHNLPPVERRSSATPLVVSQQSGSVAQVPSFRSKSMAVDSTRIYEHDMAGRGQDIAISPSTASSALDLAGRSMSVDGRSALPGVVPVNMNLDVESGLPSFRGTAPWTRKPGAAVVRHPDGKPMPLEELARSSPAPRTVSTRPRRNVGNTPSFHSEQVVISKTSSHAAAGNAMTESTVTSQTVPSSSSSGNSFLKSIFARKKR